MGFAVLGRQYRRDSHISISVNHDCLQTLCVLCCGGHRIKSRHRGVCDDRTHCVPVLLVSCVFTFGFVTKMCVARISIYMYVCVADLCMCERASLQNWILGSRIRVRIYIYIYVCRFHRCYAMCISQCAFSNVHRATAETMSMRSHACFTHVACLHAEEV